MRRSLLALLFILPGVAADRQRPVAPLIDQLGSKHWKERLLAAEELKRAGPSVVPELVEAARHSDLEVRHQANRLLDTHFRPPDEFAIVMVQAIEEIYEAQGLGLSERQLLESAVQAIHVDAKVPRSIQDRLQALDTSGRAAKRELLRDAWALSRQRPSVDTVIQATLRDFDDCSEYSPQGPEWTCVLRKPENAVQPETVLGVRRKGDCWDHLIDPGRKLGYVRIARFAKGTCDDLRKAVAGLREHGARGLILDLRDCPGGLLQEAVDTARLFVADGRIVSYEMRGKRREIDGKKAGSVLDLPVVCLVNGGTGSSGAASEIVAACLQDHKRAVIVGERTAGRGGVQNLLDFKPTGGQLKITTAVFVRPSGKKLHRIGKTGDDWGVKPDVVARADRQMEEALRCLGVTP